MALVLLIKIAFYWLQAKGYESMAKMKAINPKVMAMRERFKDNPQQMQQEMMRIYREEKVNPMGGCFPIMIQIPVFIALYWVLLSSVEMRGAPWIGWIHDLSAPDPYFILPVVMTLTTHAADGAEPDAAGSDAGQDDVDHAAGLQRDVLLLPGRPGAVLDHQQRAVDRAAVADQQAHGRAAAVQPAEIQKGTPSRESRAAQRPMAFERPTIPPCSPATTTPSPPSPPRPGRGAVGIVRVSGATSRRVIEARLRPRRSSRARPPTCRFALPTAAPSTRAWPSISRRRIPTPARTCWSCRRTAGRWCCSCCWRAASRPAPADPRPAAGCRPALASRANSRERAFLNDKIDLAQAEAIADLIDASTEAAARSASRSLSGEFSREIHALRDALIHLRMLVEATLDFPEEEIDFLQKADAQGQLDRLRRPLARVMQRARQGALLREGIKVVIAGQPNAGKSSLLNALAGAELAIVTPVPGTTRDVVSQTIQIEGVPLHVIDTAGPARQRRTRSRRSASSAPGAQIESADAVLFLHDLTRRGERGLRAGDAAIARAWSKSCRSGVPVIDVWNKVDCCVHAALPGGADRRPPWAGGCNLRLSRQDRRRAWTRCAAGCSKSPAGSPRPKACTSRANAMCRPCAASTPTCWKRRRIWRRRRQSLDLLAEELRLAQNALSEITGEFTVRRPAGRDLLPLLHRQVALVCRPCACIWCKPR